MGQSWLSLMLVLGLALATTFAGDHGKAKWSYHLDSNTGAEKWAELYPEECGPQRERQSPIDIITKRTIYTDELDAIDFIEKTSVSPEDQEGTSEPESNEEAGDNGEKDDGHDHHAGHNMEPAGDMPAKSTSDAARKMFIFNNGHTAQVDVEEGDLYFMSKALGREYKVAQLHFHWGKNGSGGSEHRINGDMFHLEMHVVTFDAERYSVLTEAVGKPNGLAVFSVMFKKGKHNKKLNNVVSNLKNITEPKGRDHKVYIDWLDIGEVLPASLHRYYRYHGSLTTPTCNEEVLWTVFEEHPSICPSQLKEFYSLREGRRADGEPVQLENNFRLPQPLNGRDVLASFIHGEKAVKYNVVQGGEDNGNAAPSFQYGFSSLLLCLCLAWTVLQC